MKPHILLGLLSLILSLFTQEGNAQEVLEIYRKNGIYLEGYAWRHDFNEGFVSLNYEHTFGKKNNKNLRVGVYPDFQSLVSFPVTFSWFTHPKKKHHFEYGLGAVYRLEHFKSPYTTREWFHDVPAVMLPIMYRYQDRKGFYARAGFNVFVSWPTIPSPSVSVGWRF